MEGSEEAKVRGGGGEGEGEGEERSANGEGRFQSRGNREEKDTKRTNSLSDIVSNRDASQLLERSDVESRLLPLGLGSEGVLERLGLDDVRSLERRNGE